MPEQYELMGKAAKRIRALAWMIVLFTCLAFFLLVALRFDKLSVDSFCVLSGLSLFVLICAAFQLGVTASDMKEEVRTRRKSYQTR